MNDNLIINSIRVLAADTVQKAASGHPGIALGAASPAYLVWKNMRHNPKNSEWVNRDRFILSAGHGSSLLYSLLHIFGYGLSIEDLKNFRQKGSLTPGHPEYGHTPGVEITTGPLGQGIANGVGMAWAENYLAAVFNKEGFPVIDHYTYILCGDGCLQEGVASEAASLAGTLGLGKIILVYDSNNITIEGNTNISFRENVLQRFEAYGWHTQLVQDGNDLSAVANALEQAKSVTDKPSIIEVKSIIGFGSPNKAGKASAHGEPLGTEELRLLKSGLGFDPEKCFNVPEEVYSDIAEWQKSADTAEQNWKTLFVEYKAEYPEEAKTLEKWLSGDIPTEQLDDDAFWNYTGDIATRVSSEQVLNRLCKFLPNLFGGAADLAPSTKTLMKGRGDYSKETPTGANLHFGIREHAMTAIANGMAVHGGVIPYAAGFFVFSDYMKPAMRLSAMMSLRVIFIMTHDSIGVGEDGPTHQPIEQLSALRAIPNFTVIRPCDTHETAAAWYLAVTRKKSPTAIVLSRQNLPLLQETGKGALKGAYVLRRSDKEIPDVILMASGSEVELIYKAKDVLAERGIDASVVSFPSWEVFEEQTPEYKESVLPAACTKRLAVEAASELGWHKYIGMDGAILSIDHFGMSAPAPQVFDEMGFTVQNVVQKAMNLFKD